MLRQLIPGKSLHNAITGAAATYTGKGVSLGRIRQLFNGVGGALYINDPATMYQNSTGATPVTAASQPVGLWVDQSHGGETNLGAQKYTGTWISLNGLTYDAPTGRLSGTFSATNIRPSTHCGLAAGKAYAITYNNNSAGAVRLRLTDGSGAASGDKVEGELLVTGAGKQILTATTGATHVSISSNGGNTIDVSNISVREVPGNHATQTTASARPVWDGTQIVPDAIDDTLLVTSPSTVITGGSGPLVICANALVNINTNATRLVWVGPSSGNTTAGKCVGLSIGGPNTDDDTLSTRYNDDYNAWTQLAQGSGVFSVEFPASATYANSQFRQNGQLLITQERAPTPTPLALVRDEIRLFSGRTSTGVTGLFSGRPTKGLAILPRALTNSERDLLFNFMGTL